VTSSSLSTGEQVGKFQTAEFGPRATDRIVWRVNRQEQKSLVSCSLHPYSIGSNWEELVAGENYITRNQNIRNEEKKFEILIQKKETV